MKDESGTPWAKWPLFGAVGAGRRDEVPDSPDLYEYVLTPSGQAEQDSARKVSRDTSDEVQEVNRSDGGSRAPTPQDPPAADPVAG